VQRRAPAQAAIVTGWREGNYLWQACRFRFHWGVVTSEVPTNRADNEDRSMKVMVIVKATEATEAGQLPTVAEIQAMGAFNEALVKAGIMLAGDGLRPTRHARRVTYTGAAPQVTDGPFAETRELVAGFWLWQVRSVDEATEWLTRAPFKPGDVVEIRPFMTEDDFGAAFTQELRAQEQRLREQIGQAD
jgi:hypothetical protein